MYSRGHALVSAAVGAGVAALASGPVTAVLAWAWVVAVGVGVDFDHFVVARLNRGDWTNLRRVLRDPRIAIADQPAIFDAGDVWRDQRLLSHVVIGGVLVPGAWLVAPFWALATAVSLYAHLLADLYADVRTREEYLARAARAVGAGTDGDRDDLAP